MHQFILREQKEEYQRGDGEKDQEYKSLEIGEFKGQVLSNIFSYFAQNRLMFHSLDACNFSDDFMLIKSRNQSILTTKIVSTNTLSYVNLRKSKALFLRLLILLYQPFLPQLHHKYNSPLILHAFPRFTKALSHQDKPYLSHFPPRNVPIRQNLSEILSPDKIILIQQPSMQLALESLQKWRTHEYFWEGTVTAIVAILYIFYYARFRRPHFLIKSEADLKKKNIGRPLPPYPNGWYNIMTIAQLKKGQVKSVDIAGQNLVVYRGEDGIVYALNAYCLHMGANLGVGGEVVNNNCIQCPFHGWLYDGKTGHCVDHDGKELELKSIEYNSDLCSKQGKINWIQKGAEKATLRKYPVSEINGYIYIWVHALDEFKEKPIYPLVNVESFINTLEYRGKTEHHIMCHMQDIPENGADTLHFKYVHSYITPMIKSLFFKWQAKWMRGDDPDLPSMFEHNKKYVRDFKQRVYNQIIKPFPRKEFLSIGNLENEITIPIFGKWYMFSATIIQCGLGIVFVVLKSPIYELVFHHYVQPHGKAFQQVYHDCYISSWVPYFFSSLATQLQGGQVTNDMHIWSSKKFARKAFLVEERESDKYIRNWRTWASQHYQGCESQLTNQGLTW